MPSSHSNGKNNKLVNEAQDRYDESSYQGSITIDTFRIKVNLINTWKVFEFSNYIL